MRRWRRRCAWRTTTDAAMVSSRHSHTIAVTSALLAAAGCGSDRPASNSESISDDVPTVVSTGTPVRLLPYGGSIDVLLQDRFRYGTAALFSAYRWNGEGTDPAA